MKRLPWVLIILLSTLYCHGQETRQSKDKIFGVTISLPWANGYSYYDYYSKKGAAKTGFVGLGMALFYKHHKDKFSLYAGFTADLPAPIGPVDFAHEGIRSQVGASFIDILYHHPVYWRFNVVGGINMTKHQYQLHSYVDTIPYYIRHDNSLGVVAGIEYESQRSFSLALLYRPAIIALDTKQYMHVLTLDCRFNINIIRK